MKVKYPKISFGTSCACLVLCLKLLLYYVLNVHYRLKVVIVLLPAAAVVDLTLKPETDYDVLQQYVLTEEHSWCLALKHYTVTTQMWV